jgi:uncharacterized damage-inducible protein DinB
LPQQNDELIAIKEWYRYNSYVRKKYLAGIEKLPSEEINRDRGASFPSFLDILAHTLDAYTDWFFSRYEGKLPDSSKELSGRIKSIQELKEEEKRVDSAVLKFVEALSPSDLDSTFDTSDQLNKWRFTLRQMLWHLVEEELQHRGELNALFWQMDIDPPITDWLDWKVELGEIKPLERFSK